jgi:hypothetical protein
MDWRLPRDWLPGWQPASDWQLGSPQLRDLPLDWPRPAKLALPGRLWPVQRPLSGLARHPSGRHSRRAPAPTPRRQASGYSAFGYSSFRGPSFRPCRSHVRPLGAPVHSNRSGGELQGSPFDVPQRGPAAARNEGGIALRPGKPIAVQPGAEAARQPSVPRRSHPADRAYLKGCTHRRRSQPSKTRHQATGAELRRWWTRRRT